VEKPKEDEGAVLRAHVEPRKSKKGGANGKKGKQTKKKTNTDLAGMLASSGFAEGELLRGENRKRTPEHLGGKLGAAKGI